MTTTTIGQIVFYYPGEFVGNVNQLDKDQPMLARVCYVHNDNMVNLFVVDHLGVTHAPRMVPIYKDGDEDKDGGAEYAMLELKKKPEAAPAPFVGIKPAPSAVEPVKQPAPVA